MQVKDFSSRFRLDLDSVSMSLEVSSSFSKCIMIRTSIRLPTMVGRSRVLNAFKAFILTFEGCFVVFQSTREIRFLAISGIG